MMQGNSMFRILALLLGLAFVLTTLGCSDKTFNEADNTTSVSMSFKVTSPGMIDAVSQFRVIVTAEDIDPPIQSPLVMTGRYLEGIVLVPPGDGRTFTVEASDVEGMVLYRGDTTLSITPGVVTELTINLYPQVSLIRVSPRYLEVPADAVFSVDIRAFNVRNLYGVAYHLHWQGAVIYPDSAHPLTPLGTDILWVDRIDPNLHYYAIGVTQSDRVSLLVDSNGDGDLARVFFSSFSPDFPPEAAGLSVEITELTAVYADSVGSMPNDTVSVDGSTIVVGTPEL